MTSIDDLLAESSSDEDGLDGGRSHGISGGDASKSAVGESGGTKITGRISLDEALATTDLSDDDDEDEVKPSAPAGARVTATEAAGVADSTKARASSSSVGGDGQEDTAAKAARAEAALRAAAAAAADDQLSDASNDQGEDEEAGPVATSDLKLQEVLAMDSDSSDDNLTSTGTPAVQVMRQSKTTATAQKNNRQVLATTSEQESDLANFLQSPFDWCLEHERSLLQAGADELSAGDVAVRMDGPMGGSLPSGAEAITAFRMVETQSDDKLRRLLAQETGLPTCVTANSKAVGVGTMRGAVVLLDSKGTQQGQQTQDAMSQHTVLQSPSGEDGVAVTAAAFSPDGSRMLVGHKSGQLVLWDLTANKVANIVKDVHSCAVLSVAFCRLSWQHALSADAAGSVVFLTFTNTFGRRDCARQLLLEQSSNIGITLRVMPLPQVPNMTHPADSNCLVALCATGATVLLTLNPTVQVLQKMQYHTKDAVAHANWVPDIAWLRLEMRERTDTTQVQASDPQLCIAFGQSLHVMRVSFEKGANKEEFKISLVQRYTWSAPIQCITAFNESVLAILDTSSKLSVVQLPHPDDEPRPAATQGKAPVVGPQTQHLEAVYSEDVSGWSVAYHTFTSNEGAKDARAHHGGLAVFRGRSRLLYICGMRDVWTLKIGRWNKYVEELVGKNDWSEALDIFLALRKGSLPPLLDFPSSVGSRQRAVDSRTTQVIQSYLVSRLQPDTPRTMAREMCIRTVGVCVEMELWSVLYKTVFECFKAAGHMNVYCNTLEPFIVRGKIPRNQMDSEVLSSILQSYTLQLEEETQTAEQFFRDKDDDSSEDKPHFIDCDHCPRMFPIARRLQQLVLYVDISQLDLNLAIRLFTQHRLWTALVHVYAAFGDHVSPLELLTGECVHLAKRCVNDLKQDIQEGESPLVNCLLVRKLFFFLHRCFSLKAFPVDIKEVAGISQASLGSVTELLQCLLRPDALASDKEVCRAPPVFLKLLRLSPVGIFGALSTLFTSDTLRRQECNDTIDSTKDSRQLLAPDVLFRRIEVAKKAATRQAEEEGPALPPNAEQEYMCFVARAVPRARISLPGEELRRVIDHLLAAGDSSAFGALQSGRKTLGGHSRVEAQQLLIGILAVQDTLGKEQRDIFISGAMQRGFFEAAAWLHERHAEYDRVLDCRMRDPELRQRLFEYIIETLVEERAHGGDGAVALVDATLQRLPKLVTIDAESCAAMICEQFSSLADHDTVLERLRGYPQIELQYLETLLVRRQRIHWKTAEEQQAFFDGHVVRYVELLCSLVPSSVLPFLNEHEALPLRECLELCRKHNVTDASVYLLERTGDFVTVLELLLGDYREALKQLQTAFVESRDQKSLVAKVFKRLSASKSSDLSTGEPQEVTWWEGFPDAQRCVDLLDHAYELSARNSNLMTASQLEELWFGILFATVYSLESATASQEVSKRHHAFALALGELVSKAVAGVLAYLALPRAVQRIAKERGTSPLGIWKEPLQSLLSELSFQQGLLNAARAVAAQDVVKPFQALKHMGSRGVGVAADGTPQSGVQGTPGCGPVTVTFGIKRP